MRTRIKLNKVDRLEIRTNEFINQLLKKNSRAHRTENRR